MDLEAVKATSTPDLISYAVGAAVNAQSLLDDAELLSAAGRHTRTHALAALAVEEAGKAAALSALALRPVSLRASASRAPAPMAPAEAGRRPADHRGTAGHFLRPARGHAPSQVAGILEDAQVLAQDVDRLKQR